MGNKVKTRLIILIVFTFVAGLLIVGRLFAMQIKHGESYLEQAERKVLRTSVINAPRGEILDCYGRPLVVNQESFALKIDKVSLGENDLNELIVHLTSMLRKQGESYTDTLPITGNPYAFTFSLNDTENSDFVTIQKIIEKRKLSQDASAEEVMAALKKAYNISDDYSAEEQRLIASIRYEMENRDFSASYPFTIAEDVSIETVTKVKENNGVFAGVEVDTQAIRDYVEDGVASHILGRVGSIYKDEYKSLQEKGYKMNDIVGKDGAEKAFEDLLRGTNGLRTVEQDIFGNVLGIKGTVDPDAGNNVLLTIDLNLQKEAERSLKENIELIAQKAAASHTPGYDAQSGSVVVLDIKNGDVLAMASYPTFSLSTFNEDYRELYEDPLKPMFNRALSGRYEPGSTFKMLTAIAGLETGAITLNTKITCTGVYRYYAPSYTPKCWIYNDYGLTHGTLNVKQAIEKSCNIFFFETGRLVGIDALNKYAKMFGFGDYTGIELSGEAKGVLAGRENSETSGEIWYDGDTIQAAIGQSDNLFTPLQLANYVATIANGGVHNQLHILKEAKDYETGETVYQPDLQSEDLGISQSTLDIVTDGMKKVTEDGTASSVFANYPISVAGKTGTAQVSSGSSNGVFVVFAPVDDPQIAISIIIEHGAHGNWAANIAKDIMDVYFAKDYESGALSADYSILQ